jgi:hypothetical protein
MGAKLSTRAIRKTYLRAEYGAGALRAGHRWLAGKRGNAKKKKREKKTPPFPMAATPTEVLAYGNATVAVPAELASVDLRDLFELALPLLSAEDLARLAPLLPRNTG